MSRFYALYQGDKFIDLGTVEYLAKIRHCSAQNIRVLATPSAHKKKQKCKAPWLVYAYQEPEEG